MFKKNRFVYYNVKNSKNGKKKIFLISWFIAWILTFTWLLLYKKNSKNG